MIFAFSWKKVSRFFFDFYNLYFIFENNRTEAISVLKIVQDGGQDDCPNIQIFEKGPSSLNLCHEISPQSCRSNQNIIDLKYCYKV